ncbi:MAG: DMT family transporter [Vulcanimicrobiaceae bacterium]
MTPASKAAFAAAGTSVLVGAAIVATRVVVHQVGPGSLALLRYLIGFCCLLPFTLGSARVRFEARDVLPIALLGILQFGILIALLNYALQFIPSAQAALIFATTPLLTMLLAAALGREALTASKAAGVLSSILGVALALGEKLTVHGAGVPAWIGISAAFGSAFCGAACSVFYRPYLLEYPTLQVSAFAMLSSIAFLALLAAHEGFFAALPHFSPLGWTAVAFIGASSGVGYYLWLWALGNSTPTKVTVFLALGPVTATIFGSLFLAERVTLLSFAGIACVALGLRLATYQVVSSAPAAQRS